MTDESPYSYMIVVDDTPESGVALRFAARRAMRVGARVALLHVIPPTDFIQWGGVQEAIEAEAQEKAEALLAVLAERILSETGTRPTTAIRHGKATEQIIAAIREDSSVRRLVLGAAPKGSPGPLVSFFAGEGAASLPCPMIIVPGALDEAAIERLA